MVWIVWWIVWWMECFHAGRKVVRGRFSIFDDNVLRTSDTMSAIYQGKPFFKTHEDVGKYDLEWDEIEISWEEKDFSAVFLQYWPTHSKLFVLPVCIAKMGCKQSRIWPDANLTTWNEMTVRTFLFSVAFWSARMCKILVFASKAISIIVEVSTWSSIRSRHSDARILWRVIDIPSSTGAFVSIC